MNRSTFVMAAILAWFATASGLARYEAGHGVDAARPEGTDGFERDVVGWWEGHVHFRGEPLEIRLQVESAPEPVVSVDYPQLVFANQPAEAELTDGALVVDLPLGLGRYHLRGVGGELRAERETSSGEPARIVLHRAPAFESTLEKLEFGAAGPPIGGTLTLPPGNGPFPVAILLAGAGNPTRSNLSYTSWSDLLARHGIASVAYDRRADDAVNQTGRPFTIPEHASDVITLIDRLVEDDRLDGNRISLVAKSRGGWIAIAAAARDPRVSRIVGIGIAAVNIPQQDFQAIEARMRADDEPDEMIDRALAYTRLYFHTARHPELWPHLEVARDEVAEASWAERVRQPESVEDLGWFRAQLDFDPLLSIPEIDAAWFLAWGAEDRTTPPSMNAPLFEWLMSDRAESGSVARVYEDAGHTLEGPLNVDDDPETVWAGMNQAFLRDVLEWLTSEPPRSEEVR